MNEEPMLAPIKKSTFEDVKHMYREEKDYVALDMARNNFNKLYLVEGRVGRLVGVSKEEGVYPLLIFKFPAQTRKEGLKYELFNADDSLLPMNEAELSVRQRVDSWMSYNDAGVEKAIMFDYKEVVYEPTTRDYYLGKLKAVVDNERKRMESFADYHMKEKNTLSEILTKLLLFALTLVAGLCSYYLLDILMPSEAYSFQQMINIAISVWISYGLLLAISKPVEKKMYNKEKKINNSLIEISEEMVLLLTKIGVESAKSWSKRMTFKEYKEKIDKVYSSVIKREYA